MLHKDYLEYLKLPVTQRQNLQGTNCPLYHWTIRSTAKSRASSNSIVVSFQTQGLILEPPKEERQGTTPLDSSAAKQKFQIPASTHRFHLIAEQDLGTIPDKDDIGPTTNLSNNAGKQVSAWIRACNHTHSNCTNVSKAAWVPKRLLDLQFGDLTSIRLVNTSEEGIMASYATLSHCWGPKTKENEFITTLGETENLYMTKGIKVSALSTNFQQAIAVARFIGVRYIWIDSLCIIQGEHSDFHTEGQVMHKVYRNSYCNIAAADSKDSRGGLFRGRDPADILPGKYQGDGSSAMFGTKVWRIVPENLWEAKLLGSSIYTRGWVFQGKESPTDKCVSTDDVQNVCSHLGSCISHETRSSGIVGRCRRVKDYQMDCHYPWMTLLPRIDTGEVVCKSLLRLLMRLYLVPMTTLWKASGHLQC